MKKIATLILFVFIALSLSSCNAIKYHKPINLGKKLDEKNFYFDRYTKDTTDYYNYLGPLIEFYENSETNDGCYEYYYEDDEGQKIDAIVKYGLSGVRWCISTYKYKNLMFKNHYFYSGHLDSISFDFNIYKGIVYSGKMYCGSSDCEFNTSYIYENNDIDWYFQPYLNNIDKINYILINPKSLSILEWFSGFLHSPQYRDSGIEFKYEVYNNYIVLHTNMGNEKIVSYYNLKTNCFEYEEYDGYYYSRNCKLFIKKSNKLEKLEKENKRLIKKYLQISDDHLMKHLEEILSGNLE